MSHIGWIPPPPKGPDRIGGLWIVGILLCQALVYLLALVLMARLAVPFYGDVLSEVVG